MSQKTQVKKTQVLQPQEEQAKQTNQEERDALRKSLDAVATLRYPESGFEEEEEHDYLQRVRYRDLDQTRPIWSLRALEAIAEWVIKRRFYFDVIAGDWREYGPDEGDLVTDQMLSLDLELAINDLFPNVITYPDGKEIKKAVAVVKRKAMKKNHSLYPRIIEQNAPEWDGKDRLDAFTVFLGARDCYAYRQVLRSIMLALITRIYTPGLKWDYMPILQGPQGIGKSSFPVKLLEAIGLESGCISVGSDVLTDVQKLLLRSQCKFILEFAELAGFRKTSMESLKDMIGQTFAKGRLPYAPSDIVRPRHFITIGTTNEDEFLRDLTGNRRFLIIKTGRQQPTLSLWTLEGKKYLAQLWAQMLHEYNEAKKGDYLHNILWLDKENAEFFEVEATAAIDGGAYESDIENYLKDFNPGDLVCVKQIATEGLEIPYGTPEYRRISKNDIPSALKKLGYQSVGRKTLPEPWKRQTCYQVPEKKGENDG